VKFHARVTSVGESGEKNKNKKERPYISRISPGAPLRRIGTNFGLRIRLVDIINCAKFYRNRLRGHSHWIAMSPLTLLGTNVTAVIRSRFCSTCADTAAVMAAAVL